MGRGNISKVRNKTTHFRDVSGFIYGYRLCFAYKCFVLQHQHSCFTSFDLLAYFIIYTAYLRMTSKKRLKNVPVLHDEVKTKRTVVLTPTAWENIKNEARIRGVSASELIEEWGRRINSQVGFPHV
jgi:hypothetical protein